jgi:uncharacterized protein involved in cysteine biosynthesis
MVDAQVIECTYTGLWPLSFWPYLVGIVGLCCVTILACKLLDVWMTSIEYSQPPADEDERHDS